MPTLTFHRIDRHHQDSQRASLHLDKVVTTEETVAEMAETKDLRNNPLVNHHHVKEGVEETEATVEGMEVKKDRLLVQVVVMEVVDPAKVVNHDKVPVT
jgi:hypothetical protein